MIPNYSRKAISGWSNDPCKVISHKIDEKKMGYRGSKSKSNQVVQGDFVKEQRVDGSWSNNNAMTKKLLLLRCTLMGVERHYQVNILSNQFKLNKRNFSSLVKNSKLNP
jgi:hypothetical protein